MENKKLSDLLVSNRLQYEEEVRDLRNKARDQEIKKVKHLTKTFKQKLKLTEDSKEGLNRKIQELIRAIQDKDNKYTEAERDFQAEI